MDWKYLCKSDNAWLLGEQIPSFICRMILVICVMQFEATLKAFDSWQMTPRSETKLMRLND